MRTSLLIVVPCILLGGLLWGAYALYGFSPEAPGCTVGQCSLTLRESDSRRVFTYRPGMQFNVVLNENRNSLRGLQCIPEGVLESRGDAPSAEASLYVATFEAVAPGTCILIADNFSVTIIIESSSQ